MDNELTPQFFAPDAKGNSQSIYKAIVDNIEQLQSSQIRARNRQTSSFSKQASLTLDGIPGVPFERGEPNPDVFYQGEDIIYDLFLFHDGKVVTANDYDVWVSVKSSPRSFREIFLARIEEGLFQVENSPGRFELWIPSKNTASLHAGTYYIDVLLAEKLGAGKGRFDRRYLLVQHYFNLEYSNFSEHPETSSTYPGALTRGGIEVTWPNSPNTIGKSAGMPDENWNVSQ